MKQALYYSIASAACAGLLVGGTMKLGPDALSEIGGPQILISGGGERAASGAYDNGGVLFTSQNGDVPEYVVGTDWTRPQYAALSYDVGYQDADDSYAPTAPAADANIDEAVYTAPIKISSPPKLQPVSYPSIDGDVVGHAEEADQAAGPKVIHVVEAADSDETLPS